MRAERHAITKKIADLYDQWAPSYDSDPNRTRDLCGEVLRRMLTDRELGDVLEIGCGTGANTEWLVERSRTVIGLDFSDGMLAIARRRIQASSARFLKHDVRHVWPLPDRSADWVIATLILEHVRTLEAVFNEAHRVLRPGGELFVGELHPDRQATGAQAEFRSTGSGSFRIPSFIHGVGEYVNAATRAGLKVTRLDHLSDEPDVRNSEPPRLLAIRCQRQR